MNNTTPGLETFVDHHRADFDAFEPRPDLWDAIAQDLDRASDAPEAVEAPGRVLPLFPAAATSFTSQTSDTAADARSARPYGIAAAVAALLLLGTWFWQQRPEATIWTRAGQPVNLHRAPVPALTPYTVPELATPASEGPEQRLASAVQRLETYYAVQLAERRQELQVADRETAAPQSEWEQELAALDSDYQQLKVELYRNPEPAVVLDAMNRNMQIRLDLLGQQLRTREQIRAYHTQPYMVADSRRTP